MAIYFDNRWIGQHGIGRFAGELYDRIPAIGLPCAGRPMSPFDPLRLSRIRLAESDILVSPGYNAPLYSRFPFILSLHDVNQLSMTGSIGTLKSLYFDVFIKSACARSAAVLTVSEWSRREILRWSGLSDEKVVNVGNGVSSVFTPIGPRFGIGRPYVYLIGNRKAHKNEIGGLKAFYLSGASESHDLVITGDRSPSLDCLARDLGIGDKLHALGRVSDSVLASVYRGAAAVLFPSLYEGFGLPIIEAFSCGAPVIASNIEPLSEVGGSSAALVNPYDEYDIASVLAEVLYDGKLRERMVADGFNISSTYTWEQVAEKTMSVIGRVLG